MSSSFNLDSAAVERLQRLGGNQFVGKMIDLFTSYAAEKLASAKIAQSAGELKALADAVHPIKSSAGNVGAKRVQELAGQIETAARGASTEDLSNLLAEMEGAFVAARSELEQVKASLIEKTNQPK
jgi:HPt (histidine-containing phosphotransfer) domain-containing protein